MQCSHCQKNPASVRVDQMINGQRASRYFCQPCAESFMEKERKHVSELSEPKEAQRSTTVLQIIPAHPGTAIVRVSSELTKFLKEGEPLYFTESLACWALVEYVDRSSNGSESTSRAVVGMTKADNMVELRPLVENDGFLGYSLPGDETDWNAEAKRRRRELGRE